MRYAHTILVIASAVVVAGCAVGPNYRRPQPPVNAGYAPDPLPQTSASAPIHGGEAQRLLGGDDIPFAWWEQFGSPELNALVERAFSANPTIAAAQAALVQSQELVIAQRGYFFPTFGASYNFQRTKIAGNFTLDDAPGTQGDGHNLNPPLLDLQNSPHTAPLFYDFHTAELTVGFVPDVFGANWRQMESLAAQRDAQRFALEATYITLASNVVAAAIQEASLRAQLRATQQLIAADREALRILRDQFRLGSAMRVDVAAQETALAQAESGCTADLRA
jgi:outer membrane protein TolC